MPVPFFIAGPTAVGKSSLALEVAKKCGGEIVGADAFQVYRGLDILTAKPGAEARAEIPHWMVDIVDVSASFDVAQYLEGARRAIEEIASRGKLPIVVGGTGLYIRALTHGLADLPAADAGVRAELEALGLEELQARLAALDPACASRIDLKNKRRLVRTIEVCILTGRPFSEFRREWDAAPVTSNGVLLVRERGDLHERIDRRVDAMFDAGVVEEVRRLETPGPTVRQAIGWKEIDAHLNGKMTQAECVEAIKRMTRKYAKRQLTWFRGQASFAEINLSSSLNPESAAESIVRRVGSSPMPADV